MNDAVVSDQPTGVINLRPTSVIDEGKARQALDQMVKATQGNKGKVLTESEIYVVEVLCTNLPPEEVKSYRVDLGLESALEQVLGPGGVAELQTIVSTAVNQAFQRFYPTSTNNSPPSVERKLLNAKNEINRPTRTIPRLSMRAKKVLWMIAVLSIVLGAWWQFS